MTWVGYVPGIDINRQMLLRKMPKTPIGRAEHARMRPLGRQALAARMPESIFRAPVCEDGAGRSVLLAGAVILGVAVPTFLFLRYRDRA